MANNVFYTDVVIPATSKLRLDGSASGNTYISESAGDHISFVTNSSTALQIDSNQSVKVVAGSLQISGDNANYATLTESGSGTLTIVCQDEFVLQTTSTSSVTDQRIRIDTVGQPRIGCAGSGNAESENKTSIGADLAPTSILTVYDFQDSSSYSGIAIKQYNDPYDNNGFFGYMNCVGGTFNLVAKSGGRIKFMDGQSSATNMEISGAGEITLNGYGSGTYTGTSAYYLIADSSGNLIEKTPAQVRADIGAGTGSGTMTGFGVASSVGGSSFTISNGETVSIVGGTNISTTLSQANESVTINNDLTDNQQLINGANYITSASLPDVSNATITLTAGTGMSGGGVITLNQSANETITFTNDGIVSFSVSNNSVTGSIGDGGTLKVLGGTGLDSTLSGSSGSGTFTLAIDSTVLTTTGTQTITGVKTHNANLDIGDYNIRFGNTSGGAGDGILYKDSTGSYRTALTFEATNTVVLSNRAANGEIEFRANTSTASVSGEQLVATVKDNGLVMTRPIVLNPGTSDSIGSGTAIFNGGSSVTKGYIYYWTGSAWTLATPSNAYNRLVGMAIATGVSGTVGMMLRGMVNGSQTSTTSGQAAYLTTGGGITNTVPTSDYARIMGYAISSTVFYFDPDKTWVDLN